MVFNDFGDDESKPEAPANSQEFIDEAEEFLKNKKPELERYRELAKNLPDIDPSVAALKGTEEAARGLEKAIVEVQQNRMNPQTLREAKQIRENFETKFKQLEAFFSATP